MSLEVLEFSPTRPPVQAPAAVQGAVRGRQICANCGQKIPAAISIIIAVGLGTLGVLIVGGFFAVNAMSGLPAIAGSLIFLGIGIYAYPTSQKKVSDLNDQNPNRTTQKEAKDGGWEPYDHLIK